MTLVINVTAHGTAPTLEGMREDVVSQSVYFLCCCNNMDGVKSGAPKAKFDVPFYSLHICLLVSV